MLHWRLFLLPREEATVASELRGATPTISMQQEEEEEEERENTSHALHQVNRSQKSNNLNCPEEYAPITCSYYPLFPSNTHLHVSRDFHRVPLKRKRQKKRVVSACAEGEADQSAPLCERLALGRARPPFRVVSCRAPEAFIVYLRLDFSLFEEANETSWHTPSSILLLQPVVLLAFFHTRLPSSYSTLFQQTSKTALFMHPNCYQPTVPHRILPCYRPPQSCLDATPVRQNPWQHTLTLFCLEQSFSEASHSISKTHPRELGL